MTEKRGGYGFTNEDKALIRDRADGRCDFGDNSCERPNNNTVHHLTGCYEGKLKGTPKEWVSDVEENALMLCDLHTEMHDVEERRIVDIYEAEKRTQRILHNTRRTRRATRQKERQLRKRRRAAKQFTSGRTGYGRYSHTGNFG